MKKLNLSPLKNLFNAPGFYVPVSSLALAASLLFQHEIRQTVGVDEKQELIAPKHPSKMPEIYNRRTAYHEAAHMVTILAFNRPFLNAEYITMLPKGSAIAHVQFTKENLHAADTTEDELARIVNCYAGHAAEKEFFGTATSGTSADISSATEIAMGMTHNGQGKLTPVDYIALQNNFMLGQDSAEALQNEIIARLIDSYAAAQNVVTTYRVSIEKLATTLLKDRDYTLTYEECKTLLGFEEGKGLPVISETGKKTFIKDPIAHFFPPQPEEEMTAEPQPKEDPPEHKTRFDEIMERIKERRGKEPSGPAAPELVP